MSQDKIKDANGAVRVRKLKKDRQHNGQRKGAKGTNIDKQNTTLKLMVEERESHRESRMNSGAAEGKTVPAPPVTPVVLLFICYAEANMPK